MSSAGGCPSRQKMVSVGTSIVPPGPCPPSADTPGISPAVTTPQVTASLHDFAGSLGKYLDLDVAAAGNTEVIRAKMRTMAALNLNDTIEDILITLSKQYHIIRLLKNADGSQGLFLYLVLDRAKSNLALARHQLKRIDAELTV